MKRGGKFLLPRNKFYFKHKHTQRHAHREGLAVVQVTAWVLLMRNCTVLPRPQPLFFSDPIRSEMSKHVPLKGTCLLYIWKLSGDLGREGSTLDKLSKIRCFGHHQWSPQRVMASLLVYTLAPELCGMARWKDVFSTSVSPYASEMSHSESRVLLSWTSSFCCWGMHHLMWTPVQEKEVLGLCFNVFYAFLPKFFSMMVCSKVLNPPLCWGWKWAVFIWWRTLAVWLSWSDRRFLEAVKPTKLCSDTWPANRPENPPSWWVLHAKLPGPISGPATVKSQKKRRNPLWQPLSREHWQGERSVERVWGIQLSHSQNVQIYNQSWGTILTFAWHLLLL